MWREFSHSAGVMIREPYRVNTISRVTVINLIQQTFLMALPLLLFAWLFADVTLAQSGGGHTLYGDLKVDESKVEGLKPITFNIILYSESGSIVGRQTVPNNGRYRFMELRNGFYDVVVEVENNEVARLRTHVSSPFKNDFRQDIFMEWQPNFAGKKRDKAGTVSAANFYKRTSANKTLFDKAGEAIDKRNYDQAISLLHQLTTADPKDYQAWSELGTVYLMQKNLSEAEKAYQQAVEVQPSFILALLNLGRLRMMQKNYEGAIEVLTRAVKVQPLSADANYYLGEAYLQIKKGSKAVSYLYEALRIDPVGMAEAHLRLAALYNGAGLKDKAAAEYEQFLAKKPEHPDKKKFQQYIAENKKP